ncbi:MAG: hypothetical protein ACKVP5_14420 [Aestuariivirga sp.]
MAADFETIAFLSQVVGVVDRPTGQPVKFTLDGLQNGDIIHAVDFDSSPASGPDF